MQIENNRTEFKETLNDKLEKEIVGFLNYQEGGILYIGINNDGVVVGVNDIDDIQLRVTDRIKNNILPSTLGLFDVITEVNDGKDVMKIIISSGPEKPYYIKTQGMSPSGCFIRIGSATHPMTTAKIDELYSKCTRNSLGKIASPRKELSFEQLKIYYEENGHALNKKFAQSLELLADDKQYNYAAYLISDENSISMKVAKYSGKDKVDLIENAEFGYCSIIKATKNILNKLDVENVTKTKITSKERIEKRLIDQVALREALINAIVHNDYSNEIPPLVEIFLDRIVITSSGGLPQALTLDEFFSGFSAPRNKELMRIFKDVKLVEQLGSGILRILKSYDRSIYEISTNFIRVTFMFDLEQIEGSNNDQKKWLENDQKTTRKRLENVIDKTQNDIILEIKQDNAITIKQLSERLNFGITKIKSNITKLKELGILKRVGPDKGGYWEVEVNYEE